MITFDQTTIRNDAGKISLTPESEAVRLYNDVLPKPAKFGIDSQGKRYDFPAKRGIDLVTCTFMDAVNWLADTRIKKSESSIGFVHRFLSDKFPNEYAQNRDKIDSRYKLEYEMIQSNSKNDVTWLGEVGFQNMVRLDDSLTNPNVRLLKLRNGEINIVRI